MKTGNVYVVGIGPGEERFLTVQARAALESADVLCGYALYVDLVAPLYPDKTTDRTTMREELERCRRALETARTGKHVALVCSGDAGVYGMAAPLLELAAAYPDIDIEIVPGVTAALAGAALLGAPLGHDFCVISLSDLLTPWETIARRIRCAVEGDFVICLYNPSSSRRKDRLRRACDIMLSIRDGGTVCGLTRKIGRTGQTSRLLTLSELQDAETDMFTTVFVGSSSTRLLQGRMVTPRGYAISGL